MKEMIEVAKAKDALLQKHHPLSLMVNYYSLPLNAAGDNGAEKTSHWSLKNMNLGDTDVRTFQDRSKSIILLFLSIVSFSDFYIGNIRWAYLICMKYENIILVDNLKVHFINKNTWMCYSCMNPYFEYVHVLWELKLAVYAGDILYILWQNWKAYFYHIIHSSIHRI